MTFEQIALQIYCALLAAKETTPQEREAMVKSSYKLAELFTSEGRAQNRGTGTDANDPKDKMPY